MTTTSSRTLPPSRAERRMNILHAINCLDPRYGGPSCAIRHIVREQVRAGCRVSLLATTAQHAETWEPQDVFARRMQDDPDLAGASTFLGTAYGRRSIWASYSFSPQCGRWLRRRLKSDWRPDVVHIHGVFDHLTIAAAAWARRRAIPYVIRPAGSLDSQCFRMRSYLLKRVFMRLVLRRDLHRAACVHAVSQSEADDLARLLPKEQIRIVPLGADVPSFDAADASRRFLARFPELQGRRVLLFLSRVTAKKRPELLVEAMTRLRTEYPDLALLIVGNSDRHGAVLQAAVEEHHLEDSVVHAGFLQGPLKRGAFAVADLFALPSVDENFAMVVVEAMAHGVPVLVTPGVATHVYVDRSGAGATVGGSVAEIARGIRSLLESDRQRVGQRGRRFVQQNLSWHSTAEQLDELYRCILEDKEIPLHPEPAKTSRAAA